MCRHGTLPQHAWSFSPLLALYLKSLCIQADNAQHQQHFRHIPKLQRQFVGRNVTFTLESLNAGGESYISKVHDSMLADFVMDETMWQITQYIVGWRPVVQKHRCPSSEVVELVHHMNVYASDSLELDVDKARIVASYDRGAEAYDFPAGYGIPIGPGSPGQYIIADYHMLRPKCWDFNAMPSVVDTSGIELILSSSPPLRFAALVGFTDENMRISPLQGWQVQSNSISDDGMKELFRCCGEDREQSSLELLAAHLHTHDVAVSKWFEVQNSTGSLVFRSKEEPTGYAPGIQSLLSIGTMGWPRLWLSNRMQLSQHCKFNSDVLKKPLIDGVSWGQEMCAAVLLVGGYLHSSCLPRTMLSMSNGYVSSDR